MRRFFEGPVLEFVPTARTIQQDTIDVENRTLTAFTPRANATMPAQPTGPSAPDLLIILCQDFFDEADLLMSAYSDRSQGDEMDG